MSESTHDDELAAFQARLARLQPSPDGIHIARLLFDAGRRSASRRTWAWPCVTAASMILAASLGFVLLLRPLPQPTERIVTVFVPSPTPPSEAVGAASRAVPQVRLGSPDLPGQPLPPLEPSMSTDAEQPASGMDYLQLRREVLTKGLNALPPPTPWPAAAPVSDADTLLDLPRGSQEPWLQNMKRSFNFGGAL